MKRRSLSVPHPEKRRKWTKVIQPFIKYNRGISMFGHPVDFFFYLQKMVMGGYQIKINIPSTLTGVHDNCLMTVFSGQNQKIGSIVFASNISKSKFGGLVDKQCMEAVKQLRKKGDFLQPLFAETQDAINSKSYCLPFVVIKQKSNNDNSTYIWNTHQYGKTNNIDVNQIAQSYIFPKSFTAIITRFFFYPNQKTHTSAAYNIENVLEFTIKKMAKSQWKVIQTNENSCVFLKIMHENKSFYQQTINLVKSLQKYLQQKVLRIVTDWVKDTQGRYYLIDLKQLQLSQKIARLKCNRRSLTELLSVVSCSMCLQNYNQSQIKKVLTNKLIQKFVKHLQKREVQLSFRLNHKKILDISKVCDLCYQLVVQEHKLMEIQRQMAIICRISQSDSKISTNKKIKDQQMIKSDILNKEKNMHQKQMYKWKLFFFIEEIKNFSNIFKKCPQQQIVLYLHIKVCDIVKSFLLKRQETSIVRGIILQNLFSYKQEMVEFLPKAEIEVQVSSQKTWSKPIAQGSLHGIYDSEQIRVQNLFPRKFKQILMFTNDAEYSVLGLYIGLQNKGLINVQELNLTKIYDVYMCNEEYTDCCELPPEWMEIIDPNYIRSPVEIENKNIQLTKGMMSLCTSIKKSNSLHYSNIKNISYRQQSPQSTLNSKKQIKKPKRIQDMQTNYKFPTISDPHKNSNRRKLIL